MTAGRVHGEQLSWGSSKFNGDGVACNKGKMLRPQNSSQLLSLFAM